MKSFNLERFVRQVSQSEQSEISCSDCLDRIDQYVEAVLAGRAQTPAHREVAQHLVQCKVCREEYEVLRDLAALEQQGRAPSVDDLKKSF